ncbi:MAG: helix-turn-helix domain-containing protein [Leptolyngbya sp.]|nr:helix-turn-helix domain-containing protein [Leptolyngbya sp.]
MKPISLIRISAVLPPILSLQRAGAPVHRYLRQANIPELVLEHPEVSVPLAAMVNFYHGAARAEGLESLGLAFTDSYHVFNLGLVGKILGQSITLYDALRQLCFISKKVTSGQTYWLIEQAHQVCFCERFDNPSTLFEGGLSGATHYAFALMLNYIRRFLGDDWQPTEVYIATPPFKQFRQEFRLETTRIHYNHSHIAICIPRHRLATSVAPALPLPSLSSERIDTWEATAPKQDFVGTLEQTLTTLLLDSYPTIEVTADVVGISIRTLQRNLSQQGLTYSRLMDRVRYQKALSLMQDADIPLIEVAYALGFSDPANFSHAFKRWTGVSPRQFLKNRKMLVKNPSYPLNCQQR